MRADKVVGLLSCYGTEAHISGDWVRGRCPFAPWLHTHGTDNHPSFGVHVSRGTPSFFQCFTCGKSGQLIEMHAELLMLSRSSPVQYAWAAASDLIASEHDDLNLSDEEIAQAIRQSREAPPLNEYPEDWLSTFPVAYNHPYLLGRGLSSEVCKSFDIRWDPVRNRVCFPFRTFDGKLVGMQGRDTTGQSHIRYLTYTYQKLKNGHVWLHEDKVDREWPVLLVEGPIDAMKVAMVYPNVLAAMTSQITQAKWDRVKDAPAFVTFFDAGAAGDKARSKVDKLSLASNVIHVVPPPGRDDPGEMTVSEIQSKLEFLS
jgi:hypothetical protein